MSNAVHNIANHFIAPIIMIIATPYFVRRLGMEHYGIWMLANAVVGTVGAFAVGLGDATTKYVATYRGQRDSVGVAKVVHATLTMHFVIGLLLGGAIYATAPLMGSRIFPIDAASSAVAVAAFRIAGIGLLARSIDAVFASTLRGYERYDLAARVSVATRIVGILGAIGAVALGYGVPGAVAATVAGVILGAVVELLVCRHLLGASVLRFTLDYGVLKKVLTFGTFSWIEGLGAILFSQLDRVLIGSMLGPTLLGYYTVCLQLAQQIHSVTAAGLHVVFPMVSSKIAAAGREAVKVLYKKSVAINVLLVMLLALPLLLFGEPILRLWLGADIASVTHTILFVLTLAFTLVAFNVVPHNTLLGLGRIQYASLANIFGGVLTLLGLFVLVPPLGLMGAASARLLYGPVVSFNYVRVARLLR